MVLNTILEETMKNEETVTCPICHGDKGVPYKHYVARGKDDYDVDVGSDPCECCNARGYISKSFAAEIDSAMERANKAILEPVDHSEIPF